MTGSAGLDNFLCPCCVVAKRAQADKPLVPSVNYVEEIHHSRSLNVLETVGSEIILRSSKKAALRRKKTPKRTQKQRVPQALQYTLFVFASYVFLLGTLVSTPLFFVFGDCHGGKAASQ